MMQAEEMDPAMEIEGGTTGDDVGEANNLETGMETVRKHDLYPAT